MDSLKIAASKVKKSPKALKVKIDNAFNKESKNLHQLFFSTLFLSTRSFYKIANKVDFAKNYEMFIFF